MTVRTALLFLLIVGIVIALIYVGRAASDPPIEGAAPEIEPASVFPDPQVEVLRLKLRAEHARYLDARRRTRQLQRVLMHKQSTREALQLACTVYGSCGTLWRRASCESGFNPRAQNRYSDAAGLFQFLGSTWRSTPFGTLDVFSPYANALAAGWMQANGRGGEWVCR